MQTDRLYLRHRSPELFEEVMGRPTPEQLCFFGFSSESELNYAVGRMKWRLSNRSIGLVLWDIIEKDTQRVAGNCGYHSWLEEHQRAELGYALHEPFRGKGYITEALQKVVEYGFSVMDLNRIEAMISPDNEPSRKVVRRLGFTLEGLLRQHYKSGDKIWDSEVYGLLRAEYRTFS